MKRRVIAIGLDAADPRLLNKWMSQGHLKNLSQLRAKGGYGRVKTKVDYCGKPTDFSATEPLWAMFNSGCGANRTGYWDTSKFYPDTYNIVCDSVKSGYDYQEYPPFYALGDDYRVAVFDVPVTALSDKVNGVQVLGWGGHFPYTVSASNPPGLYDEIVEKHGKNPVLFNDTGMWWRKKYVSWIKQALKQSVSGHKAIAKELLDKGPWDLFLMGFGETHTVGHDLYNYSQPDHPLYPHLTDNGKAPDPVLETYEDIDKAIGEIIAEADEDTYVMCFSVHGMGPNFADMLSMAFLPEFLYRFSFPGKVALSSGEVGSPPPSMVTKPIRNAWPGQIWGEMNEPNPIRRFWRTWTHKKLLRGKKHGLWSPYALTQPPIQKDIDLGWMPAIWYSDLWPEMKAFAIPGYTNGHIRINLKGRESSGIVEPADYDSLCEQIIDMVYKLTDARTGKPIAKQVVRTRQHASEDDPKLPDADIVVIWNEAVTDVVDSPDLGRVGPLTHARAGSHLGEGFMVLAGPDIPAGYEFEDMQAMDLAPTILSLMDAPLPDYLDGHSVLPSKVLS